jgi:predicted alpha/beta hydrolase family esterase
MTTTSVGAHSTPVLLIPGIGNSGPDHWQSRWQAAAPNYRRVMQNDWDHPRCQEWVAALEQAVAQTGADSVLVAHSLGCLLVAHWMQGTRLRVAGALLVAVPDPDGSQFPKEAIGFAPVPRAPLSCPSIVVASQDDPYASAGFARACAASWGSRLVDIGKAGHINTASGLGDWAAGHDLLEQLTS